MYRSFLIISLLFLVLMPTGLAQPFATVERAREVEDSLRSVWETTEGLEHAVLSEQLGVWIGDPGYLVPEVWDDRVQALYEISMLSARRFPRIGAPGPRRGEQIPETAVHWSKALRDLKRDLLTERFTQLEQSYYMVWPVLPSIRYLAEGELALDRHEPDSAEKAFREALDAASHHRVAQEAELGIARALYDQRDFEAAYNVLWDALSNGAFSDDLMYQLSMTLIRLGRVREAVALNQYVLDINPLHERAHYMLGNGYTALNYTQLRRQYPQCFPKGQAAVRLRSAREWLLDGERDLAAAQLESLAQENPDFVEPKVILAELAWHDNNFNTAERLLFDALDACPDYGRAHAVFARVQEMRRLRQSARRLAMRQYFDSVDMPEIDGVVAFISNWRTLTPALQKRVALAVEPWQAFLPALNAAGQTHYIKPMYELLSEAPYMESLKDQRINLDSRLWDDVRGVGGFHSVTGVEDVRRMMYGGYNTLVHELTHQIHGILTTEQKQRIEELYRNARTREAGDAPTFMSRYQGSTVWEYFAEGVNAYVTERYDEYDDREMLRDRLEELDMPLRDMVADFLTITDVRENIAVGKVNASMQQLEYGRADSAWAMLEAIDPQWDNKPYVLDARSTIASILDNDESAVKFARRYTEAQPADAGGWIQLASAIEFAVPPAELESADETPARVLERGMGRVNEQERVRVRLALANQLYRDGEFDRALLQYDSVLAAHPGHPSALWGRASTQASLAFSPSVTPDTIMAVSGETLYDSTLFALAMEDFEGAMRERSGVVELRLEYARVLLQAGKYDEADEQISEAESLQPEDPAPMAYRGWLLKLQGEDRQADQLLARALALEPTPDAAVIIAQHLGIVDARPVSAIIAEWEKRGPYYVYNPRRFYYEARQVIEPWMGEL